MIASEAHVEKCMQAFFGTAELAYIFRNLNVLDKTAQQHVCLDVIKPSYCEKVRFSATKPK